jgi:hypothetical protein
MIPTLTMEIITEYARKGLRTGMPASISAFVLDKLTKKKSIRISPVIGFYVDGRLNFKNILWAALDSCGGKCCHLSL